MKRRSVLVVAAVLALSGGLLPAHAAVQPRLSAPAATPVDRANALLAQMTLAEKVAMMHQGASCVYDACVDGNTRLGIPQLRLQDGPAGVADGAIGATQLPAPVAGAASWDTALMSQYGQVIGAEEFGKGVNTLLGPTINIVRDPRWGRAFESLSEDPFLASQLDAPEIQAIQAQGPIVEVKHYADYNQETFRNTPQDNVIMADKTQREIYLPAFVSAIQQGKANAAMCSYATVNGTDACENGLLLNTILKGELGFTGFVGSDFGGTHSTVNAANNGLDQEMTGSTFFGDPLIAAVNAGQVSQATIDDHVRRILTAMFAQGLFDNPQTGTMAATVTSAAHQAVATQTAEEGSVLLKNSSVLPVGGSTSIAVIGNDAGANVMTSGGGSTQVNPSTLASVVTPFQGIKARAGSGANVTFAQGVASPTGDIVDTSFLKPSSGTGTGLTGQYFNNTSFSGTPVVTQNDPNVNFLWGGQPPLPGVPGTSWSAKWTGTLTPPTTGNFTFNLTSDDGSRLFINGQQIINNFKDQPPTTMSGNVNLTAGQPVSIEVDYFQDGGGSQVNLGWQIPNQNLHDPAVAAARAAQVAVVFVSKGEGEGADLSDINLSADQNQLISDVAAANPNTVVVVNSGSAVTMPWANSVKGIVENWYPGQTDGNSIAALLYGDVNFSGKLPVTFPQSLADVPASTQAQWPGQNGTVQYSEGVNVGYRWYDSQNKTPMFPFGFGLSYTNYAYSNLTVGTPDANGNVAVGFDVQNTGSRAGAEVAQVYVGQPSSAGEPPKNLRGFSRVSLNPGQTQHVGVTLDARSFQSWTNGAWVNSAGTNQIMVGASSRDIRLTGSVTIGGAPVGHVISFRAHANNMIVTADNAGASPLIANRTAIGPWEQFDEIDLGNGNIALRAHANNMIVTAENAGASALIANRTAVGQWETFGLIHNADGSISLRAMANNNIVTAENAGAAPLIANRTAIGPWEEFDLIND
ncbi:MAG TPA: glycoside hydrolase family 3 C-terminal domain-containing protein [Pseudonocardiaceae bacterium]